MRFTDLSWRTIFIGLAWAAGVFIGVRYVFGQVFDPTLRALIILAGAPLGALAGGYAIARQLSYLVMLHAALVAVLDAGLLILLRLLPANPLLLGGILAAALLGAFIGQRAPVSAAGTPFAVGRGYSSRGYREARPALRLPGWLWRIWAPLRRMLTNRQAGQYYEQLLRRTRMDRDLADRLIEYERRRNPYASRATLIRNALERLERDNR